MVKARKPAQKLKPKPKRRVPIRPGLRYDLLVRAKFRCQACGVPATEARLEIDHKRPIALGGESSLKNCQVLCRAYNRGKGAKGKAAVKRQKRGFPKNQENPK